ncbi:hypothetical protein K469DRAFT_554380 [Zopfia rhizophila CBS 207.26]|uniref:DUF7729 domain-containing protein n=1 Tax=Zopfia rhizophila CBS 207.26 TaxID=1314779 RepID=A0A6A6EMI7_9PEZI|nr:hypothetical protein K469DRAFT_554380 [Zopfia rhizophila CBS 207.26]
MSHHDEVWDSSATAGHSRRANHSKQQQASQTGQQHSNIKSAASTPSLNLNALLSFIVIIVILALLGTASAQETHGDRQRSASLPIDELESAWKGPSLLVIDTRPPPVPPLMHLQRRDGEATKTTSSPASKATLSTDPNTSPTDSSIPQPFDTALSNNFTNPCQAFLRQMLTNESFTACHPFSLLLQTSSGFFDASKSFVRITNTLEATCNVNATKCLNVMNELARALKDDSNCAVDYSNDNPQVLQAYNGLIAYQPLYQASCLRDDDGSYCFANAITNTTARTDAYPYYLPLGVALPGGARPTCNSCLQDVMAIFSSFGSNSTQPVSQTYNGAAQQIDLYCGPTFVNKTATPLKGAAPGTTVSLTPTITLFIMLLLYFF